jgi:hypothetical protein
MFLRDIQAKFQALSSNLEDICAEQLQSIKPAEFGMSEQANACQFYVGILIRFLISISMPSELVL